MFLWKILSDFPKVLVLFANLNAQSTTQVIAVSLIFNYNIKMTLNSYLSLDTDNFNEIVDFHLNFLNEISSKNFPYEKRLQLKGTAKKFIDCMYQTTYLNQEKHDEYFHIIDELDKILTHLDRSENRSKLAKLLFPSLKDFRVKEEFSKLYSFTLEIINDANKTLEYRYKNININDFYNPENSNKEQIKKLILDAIDLINEDNSLTEKSKKELVKYLNKVLNRLDSEHINWTDIIGRIKETVIILGALSTIIGNVSPLFQAKEKLEETTKVIEKTSVNLNYKVINETFNHTEIKNLNSSSSVILQLERNNEIEKNN